MAPEPAIVGCDVGGDDLEVGVADDGRPGQLAGDRADRVPDVAELLAAGIEPLGLTVEEPLEVSDDLGRLSGR